MLWHSHKRTFLFLFLSVCCLLVHAQSALGCSCAARRSVLDSFDNSDVVIIARAISIEKAPPDSKERYVDGVRATTLVVEKVFKGNMKVREELVFGQGGGADCIWTFNEKSIGTEYLLYLGLPSKYGRDYLDPNLWYAVVCGRSTGLESATEDLLYLENMEKLRGKTRISGTVGSGWWGNSDAKVAERKVRIIGPKKTYEATTDREGVFEIYDLPPGKYWIEPEIQPGWKIDPYFLRYSASVAPDAYLGRNAGPLKRVQIELEPKKHASIDIALTVDNTVSGSVIAPDGKPMYAVCVYLLSSDGDGGGGFDCTNENGQFEITEVPSGVYVLVANKDGKLSNTEPFGTLYYPNVSERARAAVISVSPGATVSNLNMVVPHVEEMVTIEGVLRYANGKPVADESVHFKAGERENTDGDLTVDSDAAGRFSLKILKGLVGELSAEDHVYVGEYLNCPELDSLIKKMGRDSAEIKTNVVNIRADKDIFNVVLKFPFPGCKKKPLPR